MHTRKLRFVRNLVDSELCPLCMNACEDEAHVLRDCQWAKEIWLVFLPNDSAAYFFSLQVWDWIKYNITSTAIQRDNWSLVFMACVWEIWKRRNEKVFNNINIPKDVVIRNILSLLSDHEAIFTVKKKPKNHVSKVVGWNKPLRGWCKLNADGSVRQDPSSAAAGGVLRDEDGRWLMGFSVKIGIATITQAELEGIREGLLIAVQRQIKALHVESDSMVVVELLKKADTSYHPYATIIEDCRFLISKFDSFRLSHIYREANFVADRLADLGHSLVSDVEHWVFPPLSVCNVLHGDSVGAVYSRLCSG